jgi:hypothetical protein
MSRKSPTIPGTTRSRLDLIVLLVVLVVYILARRFDVAEHFFRWSQLAEYYKADELLPLLLAVSMLAAWFAVRRWRAPKPQRIFSE